MSRYHHGNLRRVLIDCALAAIAERGAANLSLRDVARRAGVSHAAPAHHFGDKQGLLTAIAVEGFDGLTQATAAAAAITSRAASRGSAGRSIIPPTTRSCSIPGSCDPTTQSS